MTNTLPMLRPDLPDVVHGIVGRDPWAVQCDGCGLVQTNRALILAVQGILFSPHHPGRRLCASCRKTEGWDER